MACLAFNSRSSQNCRWTRSASRLATIWPRNKPKYKWTSISRPTGTIRDSTSSRISSAKYWNRRRPPGNQRSWTTIWWQIDKLMARSCKLFEITNGSSRSHPCINRTSQSIPSWIFRPSEVASKMRPPAVSKSKGTSSNLTRRTLAQADETSNWKLMAKTIRIIKANYSVRCNIEPSNTTSTSLITIKLQ